MKDPVYKRCHCKDDDGRELGSQCEKLRRRDGSWNPRHGTWFFAMELPPGPGGKRRARMRRGGFETREDAEAAYDDARAKVRKRSDPSSRIKTGVYLAEWLKKADHLKAKTQRNYQQIITTYLDPLLGHVELGQLTSDDIENMFAAIREWNGRLAAGEPVRTYQRNVGPAAMQRIRACLRVALNYAVDTGRLDINPAERKRVRLKAPPAWKPLAWTPAREDKFWRDYRRLSAASTSTRGDRDFTAWRTMALRPAPSMIWMPGDDGHAARFLAYAYGQKERLAPLFELIMLTAMRRGETCGLSWSHVDFDGHEILAGPERVQVGWAVEDYGGISGKSEASLRHLPAGERELALLHEVKAAQAAERLGWGSDYHDTDLVFTIENGEPVHPAAVTKAFNRIAFEAGLPPVRVHDLRHGWASYALRAGIDMTVVQHQLGHSTIKLTSDTYTTVLSELSRSAAQTVSDMVPAPAKDPAPVRPDPMRTPRGLRAVESA